MHIAILSRSRGLLWQLYTWPGSNGLSMFMHRKMFIYGVIWEHSIRHRCYMGECCVQILPIVYFRQWQPGRGRVTMNKKNMQSSKNSYNLQWMMLKISWQPGSLFHVMLRQSKEDHRFVFEEWSLQVILYCALYTVPKVIYKFLQICFFCQARFLLSKVNPSQTHNNALYGVSMCLYIVNFLKHNSKYLINLISLHIHPFIGILFYLCL